MSTNPFDFDATEISDPELLGVVSGLDGIPPPPSFDAMHDVPDGARILGELRLYRTGLGVVEASIVHNDFLINELEFAEWLVRVGQASIENLKRGT